jgi:LysM repeat protein
MKKNTAILLIVITFLAACSPTSYNQTLPTNVSPSPIFVSSTEITRTPTLTELITQTLTLTEAPTYTPTDQIYIVQPGDTCFDIYVKHGVTKEAFLNANPILKNSCFNLRLGQSLIIPLVLSTECTPSATTDPLITFSPKAALPIFTATIIYPTWTRIPTVRPAPTHQPAPTLQNAPTNPPAKSCCKICSKGKACGNSCISRSYTCHQPPGCACNG